MSTKQIKNIELIANHFGGMIKGSVYKMVDTVGDIAIQSFNTIVAMKVNGKWYNTWGGHTKSTMCHINKVNEEGLNSRVYDSLPYKKPYKHFQNAIIQY